MPVQMGKSKFSLGRSVAAHAQDSTDYGMDFSRLPGGISGGVAQLVECNMDGIYKTGDNAGQPFFRAAFTAIEPEYIMESKPYWDPDTVDPKTRTKGTAKTLPPEKQRVKGRQFSIMVPLCNTKIKGGKRAGEIEDYDTHVGEVLNILRIISSNEDFTTDLADLPDNEAEEGLKAKLSELKEQGPFVAFSTRFGNVTADRPQAMVFESLLDSRHLTHYQPSANGQAAVVDETGEAGAEEEGSVEGESAEGEAEESGSAFDEFGDLDTLAASADADPGAKKPGTREALKALKDAALKAGIEEDAIDNAGSWAEVVEMIGAAGETESEAPEEEAAEEEPAPEPWKPKVKGTCMHFPLGKDGKPVRKAVEHEILAIDAKAKTAKLKNLVTNKVIDKVPLAKLIPVI